MPDATSAPPGEPGPADGRRAARSGTPRRAGWLRLRRPRRSRRPRGHPRWRIGTPVVLLLCGALFVVSGLDSDGTDLRPGRSTDLSSVVSTESRDVEALKTRAARLGDDVSTLTAAVDDEEVNRLTREVRALEPAAGRTAVSGRGVTVTLSDASLARQRAYAGNINDLVVHQQDIQAVVNAMWLGGAQAITVQGQRLITTTGIKCSGNVVRLHGIPYAQPYVIRAVGDQAGLDRALTDSRALQIYRQYADDPEIGVGWAVRYDERIDAPAYEGPMELSYAEVAPQDG